ncbi:PD-(D/E)XK nuclease family protein [Pseudorhodoferax sp. Leaf267]|uniref:PD-(D/E)XK nuclease family protein n=1 Tax=Pseudorhodoferax sp. Leaf267 TaxID=1736316 RepID=UPI0009EA0306|nr:PD-(D/E)XK nuclease family protein [Pseudorhodoferax sp. Leaf267]
MSGWLATVLAAAVCVWCVVARHWRRRRAEWSSRPQELAGAELVYRETTFRSDAPFRLVARVDRVYRQRDGTLVLVELKTRWHHRVQPSDIVQLSAQKMALAASTGLPVAPYGYVFTQRPTGRAELRHHRVALWSTAELEALAARRRAVLQEQVWARGAESARTCEGCSFRSGCSQGQHGRGQV